MSKKRIDIKTEIKKKIEIRNNKQVYLKKRNVSQGNNQRRAYGNKKLPPSKKINVVISAFNAVEFIEECLDSIKKQTYPYNKIYLGVDGCDKTLDKIIEIKDNYQNLEVYYSAENNGPYQMFNALIKLIPNDEYIQIFGADDVMNDNMLEKMSNAKNTVVSRHHGAIFFKKDVMKIVGGFRDWRCAADSDMVFRIERGMNMKIISLPQYYFKREHDNQLTKNIKTNFKSDLRQGYIKIYEENFFSENPIIYIEPVCSKIISII